VKRIVIFSILLLILSSGCINEEKPTIEKRTDVNATSSLGPDKEVNWMGHWISEYGRETLLLEVAQDFELINPDIDVNLKYPPQIMGYRSPEETGKFIADMIKTGNIDWDVVWLNHFIYQYTAEQLDDPNCGEKHLVNFEDGEGFKQTQKSFIIDDPI